MSEFTSGFLFLREHLDTAQQAVQELTWANVLRPLNAKWAVLFVDKSPGSQPEQLASWLQKHSRTFPLMYFQHAEDHGWGYNVFCDGAEVASIAVSYEIEFHMWLDLAEARYPGIDIIEALGKTEIRDEVLSSEAYRQAVEDQYKSPNLHELSVFGTSKETVEKLQQAITAEWYFDPERRRDQVEEFKRALNIVEMEWMSYDYVIHTHFPSDEGA